MRWYRVWALGIAASMMLCGCGAQHRESQDAPQTMASPSMSPDRAVWVAVEPPLPVDMADPPEFIVAQFCKWIRPHAREVMYGKIVARPEESLEEAKQHGSDYLVLLRLETWKKSSLSSFGHEAALAITVVDVSTGKTLARNEVGAQCQFMAVALTTSPRDCIQPKIEAWTQRAFQPRTSAVRATTGEAPDGASTGGKK